MKKLIVLTIVGGLALGLFDDILASGDGHDHSHFDGGAHRRDGDPKAKETPKLQVEAVGEIIDLECYFTHPEGMGEGEEHAVCAKFCINKGIPPGIRINGKLYLLIGGGHKPPKDKVAEFAGQQVVLKGILREKEGLSVIQISEVKRAKPNQKEGLIEIETKNHDSHDHKGSEGSHGH